MAELLGNNTANGKFTWYGYNGTTFSPRMVIAADGNVGIGVTAPGQKLSVQGSSTAAAGRFTAGGNTNTLELFGSSTTGQSSGLLVNAGTNTADYAARFRNAGGSVMMNIRGDGNVGIGTTSPDSKLDVRGTASGEIARFTTFNGSDSYIYIGRDDSTSEGLTLGYNSSNGDSTIKSVNGSHPIIFEQGTSERMRINSSGATFAGNAIFTNGASFVTAASIRQQRESRLKNWVLIEGYQLIQPFEERV